MPEKFIFKTYITKIVKYRRFYLFKFLSAILLLTTVAPCSLILCLADRNLSNVKSVWYLTSLII